MYTIIDREQLSENVVKLRVSAPRVAAAAQAGQFLMIRPTKYGERIPLTFAGWDAREGWIEFVFMVVGTTTARLSALAVGDDICDITGPLGNPTVLSGDCVCIVGGGVGLAIAYTVARAACEQGRRVFVVMGARTKELLILREQFEALPLESLFITTDDGSAGEAGVVTVPLARLCEAGAIDEAFCVGPVPMMKFSALTCTKYGVPVIASLNPIMVDGTGMCGGCRVEVGGESKFACVDGPDFDAAAVNWDDLAMRQATYRTQEKRSLEAYKEACSCRN